MKKNIYKTYFDILTIRSIYLKIKILKLLNSCKIFKFLTCHLKVNFISNKFNVIKHLDLII